MKRSTRSKANPAPANAESLPFVQPQANPVVAAMLNPSGAVAVLESDQIPPDLDLSDDVAVQDFARIAYRKHILEAKETVVTALRSSGKMRDRLAAAREINDQAGLTRKVDTSDGNLSRVSALVLADAMLRLKQVMSNAQVIPLKNVTEAGLQSPQVPAILSKQNAPRTK